MLFALSAFIANALVFEVQVNFRSAAGLACVVYALLIYELLGYWADDGMMAGPLFGVAPCPTTIFTLGNQILARGRWVV